VPILRGDRGLCLGWDGSSDMDIQTVSESMAENYRQKPRTIRKEHAE